MNMKEILAVMSLKKKKKKKIPYRPEFFFSGLLSTTAYVVLITGKVTFIFTFVCFVSLSFGFHNRMLLKQRLHNE